MKLKMKKMEKLKNLQQTLFIIHKEEYFIYITHLKP